MASAAVVDQARPMKTRLISAVRGLNGLSLREKMGRASASPNDSKFFNLTQTLMNEKVNNLPKYGLFATIAQRIQPMLDDDDNNNNNKGRNNSRWKKIVKMKRTNSKSQLALRVSPGMERDVWSHLRRECQLPVCEQNLDRFTLEEMSSPEAVEAIRQTRNKISGSLNLPSGNLARMARLRQNVRKIEQKFRSHLLSNKRLSAHGRGDQGALLEENETCKYRPPRFVETGEALHLFQRYARIVVIVYQWISLIKNTNGQYNWDQELKSFVDMTVEIGQGSHTKVLDNSGLEFDKNNFKANKEISLSSEVRQILSLQPELRTPEMLKQVLHGLQTLQSLSEYPLGTQEKLCKVASYQKVDSQKVIIREGHHPECFYFILSGIGYVKKITEDPNTGEIRNVTMARLSKGQSFGELGLVFNTVRTATVESATQMELLVIRREDFLTIFMNADNPEEEPDHIRFLRTVPIFKAFPVDVLKEEPGMCLLNYFKRGSVVVEDSRETDWLYVIKSGSCEAIQRLNAVRPRLPKRRPSSKQSGLLLLGIGEPRSRINSAASSKKSKESVNSEAIQIMSLNHKKESNSKPTLMLPKIIVDSKYEGNEIKLNLPSESSVSEDENSVSSLSSSGQNNWTQSHLTVPGEGGSNKRLQVWKENTTNTKQEKNNEVFIQVELLQPGNIFGLQSVQWHGEEMTSDTDVPHLSLVSRGAEIILLSKKIFLKYANDQVKIAVKTIARPYPKAEIMQENLQIQVNWDLYRGTVLADYLAHSGGKRSLKDKF